MAIVSGMDSNSPTPVLSRRGRILKRYKQLEDDRSSWRSHWMELSDFIQPRRGRFLVETSQNNRGRRRSNKIVDNTGLLASRTCTAGMMSGMSNPARPWFKFSLQDKDLAEWRPVLEWLEDLARASRLVMNRSNWYNVLSLAYRELNTFGTGPIYRKRSFDTVWHYRPFTAGEYVIAENEDGIVDTLGREFTMTVSQIVEQFVFDQLTQKQDWRGVSTATKALWDNGRYDALVPIIHLIEPKREPEFEYGAIGPRGMPFRSVYMEEGATDDNFLGEGGHDKFPAYVPRWDVLGGDVYGTSPGMDVLGDVKQLQHEQRTKGKTLDKHVDPPMQAPTSMRGKPSSMLPGGVTYVDAKQGNQGFIPAYQTSPQMFGYFAEDIREVQERIRQGYYADLFAMMIESDRRQITATEVAERHSEKLTLLGPMVQRMNTELFDPALSDIVDEVVSTGMVPPPPPELQDTQLEVEYIGLLAQAQEAVAASSIERVMGFAGNLAGVYGEDIIDVVDPEKTIREYRRILGAPSDMLRSEQEVQQRRTEREQAVAAQAGLEQAGQAAQAAKVLSETDSRSPNALTDILGGVDV